MKTRSRSVVSICAVFAVVAVAVATAFFIAPKATADAQVQSQDAGTLYYITASTITGASTWSQSTALSIDLYVKQTFASNSYPSTYDPTAYKHMTEVQYRTYTGINTTYVVYISQGHLNISGYNTESGMHEGDCRFVTGSSNRVDVYTSGSWTSFSWRTYFTSPQSNWGAGNEWGTTGKSSFLSTINYFAVEVVTDYYPLSDAPEIIYAGLVSINGWDGYEKHDDDVDLYSHDMITQRIAVFEVTNATSNGTIIPPASTNDRNKIALQVAIKDFEGNWIPSTPSNYDNDNELLIYAYEIDSKYYFTLEMLRTQTTVCLRFKGGQDFTVFDGTPDSPTLNEWGLMVISQMNIDTISSGIIDYERNIARAQVETEYQSKLGIYYGMDLLSGVFRKIGEVLNIQVFGNIPLYVFFLIPMIMGVVYVILKFVR